MAKSQESESSEAGKPNTALVLLSQQFPIAFDQRLADGSMKMLELMGVGQFDLQRIKVPSSGGRTFELQTLKGVEAVASLDVVIAAVRGNEKNWWKNPDPSSERPSCSSSDGINGYGINSLDEKAEPGKHECAKCAWNVFGSARGGKEGKPKRGKDCKDSITMFFFRAGSRLPGFLTLPPSSLHTIRTYSLALIDAGKTVQGVITKISLVQEKNADGTAYSEVKLDYVSDLGDEAAEKRITDLGERLLVTVSKGAALAV